MKYLVAFLIVLPFTVHCQDEYTISYQSKSDAYVKGKGSRSFSSKKSLTDYLNKKWSKAIRKGYVLASIDSINWVGDTAFVSFYLGKKFKAIHINYKKEDHYLFRKTPRINERLISRHPFSPKDVQQTLAKINTYLNNHGYPFSKVYLTLNALSPDSSLAFLNIEKGPLMHISELIIKGEAKIKKKYIQNALSIKEGDVYNLQLIESISQKINQVPFIKEIRSHELLFTPEGVKLFLYLTSIPISSANGIIGIQPNPENQKTTVTGDIKLNLINILKRGEEFKLNWKSLRPKTQELDIQFSFPFLFNTSFGLETAFNLYKLDSTYLNTNFHVGIRYYFNGGSYLRMFYEKNNNNMLKGNTSSSTISGVSTNRYGLGYFRKSVDYLPNPSKGLIIKSSISTGQRKSSYLDTDSTSKELTFRGELAVIYFVPIASRHVIKLANQTAVYYAPTIYQNEVFRFGGLKTQRGFDEQRLFATTLTTFTVEYRFLVGRDSHAFAFFDQSIYERNSDKNYTKDTPYGFGLGYSFGTKAGIFSISYALGSQQGNPIQLRSGKIHFGYIAYF